MSPSFSLYHPPIHPSINSSIHSSNSSLFSLPSLPSPFLLLPSPPFPSLPLPSLPFPSFPLPSFPLPSFPLPSFPLPSPLPLFPTLLRFYVKDTFGLKTLNENGLVKMFEILGVRHFQWHTNQSVFNCCMELYLNKWCKKN